MVYQSTSKLIVVLTTCIGLLFAFVPNGNASRGVITVQPEIVQFFLSIVGLETQIVDLDREDEFNRALYTDNLGSDPILIGFPEAGIGKGVPFLLAVEGEEIVVRMAEDGGLQVVAGNEAVMPALIDDVVQCVYMILYAFFDGVLHGGCTDNVYKLLECFLWAVFQLTACLGELFTFPLPGT